MNSLKHYDRIIKYTSGELSLEERKDFEHALLSDYELREEYNAYQASEEVALLLAKMEIKSILEKESISTTKSLQKSYFPLWGIAASVALLVGIFGLFNWLQSDNLSLLDAHFHPLNISSIRNLNDKEDGLQKIYDEYLQENYTNTLTLLSKSEYTYTTYTNELLMVKAHSLLKQQQPQEALSILQKITDQNDSQYVDNALWHSGLAELMLGNHQKATEIFTTFVNGNKPFYQSKAKEVLANME